MSQSTIKAKSEQRGTRRFALQLPLSVKTGGNGPEVRMSETKDVSARGVFFYLDADMAAGSPIEFTLTLPPEITLTESIKVHCVGKVVRVDQSEKGETSVGIAAQIEQYDFLSE